MLPTQFRVRAVADTLVPDPAYAQQTGRLRFVGRRMIRADKVEDLPAGAVVRERDPVEPGDVYYVEGWVPASEPAIVPATGEFGSYYRKQIRQGHLAPADKATAEACGVPFASARKGD